MKQTLSCSVPEVERDGDAKEARGPLEMLDPKKEKSERFDVSGCWLCWCVALDRRKNKSADSFTPAFKIL
jgi:hypothetical protein